MGEEFDRAVAQAKVQIHSEMRSIEKGLERLLTDAEESAIRQVICNEPRLSVAEAWMVVNGKCPRCLK